MKNDPRETVAVRLFNAAAILIKPDVWREGGEFAWDSLTSSEKHKWLTEFYFSLPAEGKPGREQEQEPATIGVDGPEAGSVPPGEQRAAPVPSAPVRPNTAINPALNEDFTRISDSVANTILSSDPPSFTKLRSHIREAMELAVGVVFTENISAPPTLEDTPTDAMTLKEQIYKDRGAKYGSTRYNLAAAGLITRALLQQAWQQEVPDIDGRVMALINAGIKLSRSGYPGVFEPDTHEDLKIYLDIADELDPRL